MSFLNKELFKLLHHNKVTRNNARSNQIKKNVTKDGFYFQSAKSFNLTIDIREYESFKNFKTKLCGFCFV